MDQLTFDQAIEILEISDISKISKEEVPQLEKKSKKRWHPDKVAHLKDPAITKEYTQKFQQIEMACIMIVAYLAGTYQAGETFSQPHKNVYRDPEEIIRENAPEIQQTLQNLWAPIKEKKYKWSSKDVLISDGFKLKDLLSEDYREDMALLSIISFFYGFLILGILTAIATAMTPVLGVVVGIILLVQVLSCIIGFLPLSRFWLPVELNDVMLKFINFGLGIYNWAEDQIQNSDKAWVILLVRLPVLFAKLVKYVIIFPLYEIAKAVIGDKVVGVVYQKVNYYADGAEWYIDELIVKNANEMTSEELFDLSYFNTELSDFISQS